MLRWSALLLGVVTALGLRSLFTQGVLRLGGESPFLVYAAEFVALGLAGFVTGHLAGGWRALHGALMASVYILVAATASVVAESVDVWRAGSLVLPPIDYLDLVLRDVVALSAASVGGWLAGQPAAASKGRGPGETEEP